MTTANELIALARTYNPRTNEALIRDAFAFGAEMHDGQFRHSGEPYFTHPVAVTLILAEMQMDDATLVTALLHDTIEDTDASFGVVEQRFGREIAELVDGVTKLTNLQLASTRTKEAENFRKLFMAMSKDMRVILVKLADRLHNMRTIRAMRPDKQVQRNAVSAISSVLHHSRSRLSTPHDPQRLMCTIREEWARQSQPILQPQDLRAAG